MCNNLKKTTLYFKHEFQGNKFCQNKICYDITVYVQRLLRLKVCVHLNEKKKQVWNAFITWMLYNFHCV